MSDRAFFESEGNSDRAFLCSGSGRGQAFLYIGHGRRPWVWHLFFKFFGMYYFSLTAEGMFPKIIQMKVKIIQIIGG